MKSMFAAGAAALAMSAPAYAQGEVEIPRGLSLAQIRSAITSIEGMTITKETTDGGDAVFVVSIENVPFVFAAKCQEGGANCLSVAMIGFLPKQFSAAGAAINDYNATSNFGWLATDTQSGLLLVRNSAILAGNTQAGLKINLSAYIGFYIVIGDALLKGGSGGSTISLDGVEVSPRERVIDAAHQPASTFGHTPEVLQLISEKEVETGLAKVLSDPQASGRLRKIANDVYGQ